MLPPWHLVEVQSRASYEGSDRRRSFSLLSCPESLVLCFNTHFKYIFLHVFSSVDFWFGEDNAHFVIFLCAVTLFLHVFFVVVKIVFIHWGNISGATGRRWSPQWYTWSDIGNHWGTSFWRHSKTSITSFQLWKVSEMELCEFEFLIFELNINSCATPLKIRLCVIARLNQLGRSNSFVGFRPNFHNHATFSFLKWFLEHTL